MQNTAREIFLMRDFKLPREGLRSIFSWWGSHANWGLEALESCEANRKSQIPHNNLSLSPHSKTSCSILSQLHFPHYNQSRTCLSIWENQIEPANKQPHTCRLHRQPAARLQTVSRPPSSRSLSLKQPSTFLAAPEVSAYSSCVKTKKAILQFLMPMDH